LFKADAVNTTNILQPLCDAIWDKKKIPCDWSEGAIFRTPKKGALSECSNWHSITLLSIPRKVLAKVIMECLSLAVIEQCTEWVLGERIVVRRDPE